MAQNINKINIFELLEKTDLQDSDIFIVEDSYNTKRVTLQNFKKSLIEDNSLPASYRIYSSEKVQSILDEYRKNMEIGIGSIQNDVNKILEDYTSSDNLTKIITDLDDKKADKEDITKLNDALKLKRNNSDLITSSDMDTSSDETKIHIENLSQEVLNAMTGNAPVTSPAVPTGGWVTENIANGAITSSKLSNNYRYRGNITEGDINEITDDGVYLITNNVYGVPTTDGDEPDELRLLIVTRYGQNNIVQELYYTNDKMHKPYFKRKGQLTRLYMLDFKSYYEIGNENTIDRTLLDKNYNTCGVISEGNLYDFRSEGNYIVKSNVSNLPSEDDYFVTVEVFSNDKWLYRATKIDTNACDTYSSLLYILNNQTVVSTGWYTTSTMTKSRFDGEELHIFGDGISFGIGSSDIVNKSMASILRNKYGIKVINHSIGEATYGNYGEDSFEERSILTQIEHSSLSTAKYAVIFAGTKDWDSGRAIMGNNTNVDDVTFKGSINLAIKNILEQNAEIKILIVTPIWRSRIEFGDNRDCDLYSVNDRYLSDYVDALKIVSANNHIPCLDLFSSCGINQYTANIYLSNGLHLTDKGHELIADKIFSGLDFYY